MLEQQVNFHKAKHKLEKLYREPSYTHGSLFLAEIHEIIKLLNSVELGDRIVEEPDIVTKDKVALVPWTMEDRVFNVRVRRKNDHNHEYEIRGWCYLGITVFTFHFGGKKLKLIHITFKELFDHYEYSFDGKTWKPCGKEKP